MKNKKYTEIQSFWTWWLIALVIVVLYVQIQPIYANNWSIEISSYVGIGIYLIVVVAFLVMRLHTLIDEDGITIRFLPFVRRKTWKWEYIDDVYMKEYSLADYGGWGYRISKNGTAYNTKGKYGMQLILKDGTKVMIGTQNPVEIQKIIYEFKTRKNEIVD